jgi:hypothetical protein
VSCSIAAAPSPTTGPTPPDRRTRSKIPHLRRA